MRLRCRSSRGQHAIGIQLTPSSTIGELKQDIEKFTKIPAASQELKFGFPPKSLPATVPDSTTIATVGIADGDQILCEQIALAEPVAPISTTSAPSVHRPTVANDDDSDTVSVEEGVVVVREMEDDNSCLFRAIGYVVPVDRDDARVADLRKVVSNAIRHDALTYNEAILGRDPELYCQWIMQPNSWGGAIELAIFSDYFQVEIDSIDVATLRVDRFGEGKFFRRVIILYTGIHYDALAVSPGKGISGEFDQTAFEGPAAEKVLSAAVELARKWNKRKRFTDLANFTLKCAICFKGLKGQKEAQAHAVESGHAQFTEYS